MERLASSKTNSNIRLVDFYPNNGTLPRSMQFTHATISHSNAKLTPASNCYKHQPLSLITARQISMAERVATSSSESIREGHRHQYRVHPTFESGTYIIQVPKDQIYRVPPPENALIVEQRRNPEQRKGSFCSFSLCCFFSIAIPIIIAVVVLGLCFGLLKPKNPRFEVQKIVVNNHISGKSHSRSEYDITVKVHNPNERTGISYQHDGTISLFFNQQKIATGKFPSFHQDDKSSKEIDTVLESLKDIQTSTKSSKPKLTVSFSLEIKRHRENEN